MKKKRDQLTAFLLSALLLITGSAVGTTSAWADEKSPPSSIARCEQAGISKGFAITFNAEDESWFNAISSVKVAGTEYKKVTSSWDFDDRGENYRVLPTDKQVLIGEAFSDTTATCVISANGYSDLKLTLNKSKHTASIAADETEKTYKRGQNHGERRRNGDCYGKSGGRICAEVSFGSGQQRKGDYRHQFDVPNAGIRCDGDSNL